MALFSFLGMDEPTHARALSEMRRMYTQADRDIKIAFRNELGNRYHPVELSIFLAAFVEQCFRHFWGHEKKQATLKEYRETMFERHWYYGSNGMPNLPDTDNVVGLKIDLNDTIDLRNEEYAEILAVDLDRAKLYPDAKPRLTFTADAGAKRMLTHEEDLERGERLITARLHGYMRACVFAIEKL